MRIQSTKVTCSTHTHKMNNKETANIYFKFGSVINSKRTKFKLIYWVSLIHFRHMYMYIVHLPTVYYISVVQWKTRPNVKTKYELFEFLLLIYYNFCFSPICIGISANERP